jgi:hypothetical protein
VKNNDTLTPIGALNAAISVRVRVKGVAVLHLYRCKNFALMKLFQSTDQIILKNKIIVIYE